MMKDSLGVFKEISLEYDNSASTDVLTVDEYSTVSKETSLEKMMGQPRWNHSYFHELIDWK